MQYNADGSLDGPDPWQLHNLPRDRRTDPFNDDDNADDNADDERIEASSSKPDKSASVDDGEEENVCRVCRSGAAEDGKLFWPCQCSGSMKYVHETCLNDWVRVSKKNKCELCHTPLSYTSIYSSSMPHRGLPPLILLRHLIISILETMFITIRALFVAIAWLAALPYSIVWVFRFFTWTADGFGFFSILLSGGKLPASTPYNHIIRNNDSNLTSPANSSSINKRNMTEEAVKTLVDLTRSFLDSTTLDNLTSDATTATHLRRLKNTVSKFDNFFRITPNLYGDLGKIVELRRLIKGPKMIEPWKLALNMVAADMFKGQIITSVVVVLFVIGFLVREWILMNAPARPVNNNNDNNNAEQLQPLPAQQQEQHPIAMIRRREGDPPMRFVLRENDNAVVDLIPLPQEPTEQGQPREQDRQVFQFDFERLPRFDQDGNQNEIWRDMERTLERLVGDRADQEEHVDDEEQRVDGDHGAEGHAEEDEEGSDDEDDQVEAHLFTRDHVPEDEAKNVVADLQAQIASTSNRNDGSPPDQVKEDEIEPPLLRGELAPVAGAPREPAAVDPPVVIAVPRIVAGIPVDNHQDANDEELNAAIEVLQARPRPGGLEGGVGAAEGGDEFVGEDLFDDFEGVLEAIGMRGSVFTLVQNLGLMILLVSLCLGVGLWIPMILGRILAGANVVRWIMMPLRLIRLVSDPLFDAAFATLMWAPKTVFKFGMPLVLNACEGISESSKLVKICSRLAGNVTAAATTPAVEALNSSLIANGTSAAVTATSKPLAAQAVKSTFELASFHWRLMGYADDTYHRALCTGLGYASLLLGGMWYVQSTDSEYGRAFNRAIREGVAQQLTLLKVCFFVAIEIIAFPATCGLLVMFSTYHLFPGSTISGRLSQLAAAPFSGFFITWLAGTCFMFTFSAAIDAVRDAVRPGLIWFIKDPQSHDFHPIREILERTSATQARKLFTSVILYGSVIFLSLASNVLFLRYACFGILPLRWPSIRSFSLPLDLLIYRFVIPFSLGLIKPRQLAKKLWVAWAKRSAHELRLSSFLFGQRDASEEGSHVRNTWRAKWTLKKAQIHFMDGDEVDHSSNQVSTRDVVFRKDGGFARVPAVDTVRTAPGRAMIVRTTEQGFPTSSRGEEIVREQVEELKTTRKRDAYEIVYLPPWFKTRFMLWCYLSWLSSSAAVVLSLALPLVTGRYLLSLVTSTPLHDFYSLTLGGHLLGGLIWLSRNTSKLSAPDRMLAQLRTIMTTFSLAGIIVPLFLGLSIEAYLALPLQIFVPHISSLPTETTMPTIKVLHAWSLGLIVQSLLLRILRSNLVPASSVVRLAQTRAEVLWNMNCKLAALIIVNKDIYVPAFFLLTPLLAVPSLAAWATSLFVLRSVDLVRIARFTYAFVGINLTIYYISRKVQQLARAWIERRKEMEYLVERRLKNYEKPGTKEEKVGVGLE